MQRDHVLKKVAQQLANGVLLLRDLLDTPVHIVEADDVVLAEITAGLNLDNAQWNLARVL